MKNIKNLLVFFLLFNVITKNEAFSDYTNYKYNFYVYPDRIYITPNFKSEFINFTNTQMFKSHFDKIGFDRSLDLSQVNFIDKKTQYGFLQFLGKFAYENYDYFMKNKKNTIDDFILNIFQMATDSGNFDPDFYLGLITSTTDYQYIKNIQYEYLNESQKVYVIALFKKLKNWLSEILTARDFLDNENFKSSLNDMWIRLLGNKGELKDVGKIFTGEKEKNKLGQITLEQINIMGRFYRENLNTPEALGLNGKPITEDLKSLYRSLILKLTNISDINQMPALIYPTKSPLGNNGISAVEYAAMLALLQAQPKLSEKNTDLDYLSKPLIWALKNGGLNVTEDNKDVLKIDPTLSYKLSDLLIYYDTNTMNFFSNLAIEMLTSLNGANEPIDNQKYPTEKFSTLVYAILKPSLADGANPNVAAQRNKELIKNINALLAPKIPEASDGEQQTQIQTSMTTQQPLSPVNMPTFIQFDMDEFYTAIGPSFATELKAAFAKTGKPIDDENPIGQASLAYASEVFKIGDDRFKPITPENLSKVIDAVNGLENQADWPENYNRNRLIDLKTKMQHEINRLTPVPTPSAAQLTLPAYEYSLFAGEKTEHPYCYTQVTDKNFSRRFYNQCLRDKWEENPELAQRAAATEKHCLPQYDVNKTTDKGNQPEFQSCLTTNFSAREVEIAPQSSSDIDPTNISSLMAAIQKVKDELSFVSQTRRKVRLQKGDLKKAKNYVTIARRTLDDATNYANAAADPANSQNLQFYRDGINSKLNEANTTIANLKALMGLGK